MSAWESAPVVETKPKWEQAPVASNPLDNLGAFSGLVGIGETAASMATGTFGVLAGTLAGTYESIKEGDASKFKPAFDRESEPVTYAPRTKAGKDISETLAWPFEKAEKGGESFGDWIMEKTNSPELAIAGRMSVTAVPYVALSLLGRKAGRAEKPTPTENAGLTKDLTPDTTAIKEARNKITQDTVVESKTPTNETAMRDQLRSLSQETLDKVQTFLERDLSTVEIPRPGSDPKINYTNYLVTVDDAKKALIATQDLTSLTNRKKTMKQIEHEALSEGKTSADLLNANGKATPADIMIYKSVIAAAGKNTIELRNKAKTGTDTEKALFAAQFEETMALLDSFDGIKSEAGRALRVFKEPVSDEIARLNAIRKLNDKTYNGHSINDLINLTDGMLTPELVSFASKARKAKTSEQFLEAWKAGLLTGLRTHEANIASNFIAQTFNLQEHAVAAGLGKVIPRATPGDKVYFREVPAQAAGMVNGAIDGAKLAFEVLRKGETAAQAAKALDLTTRYQAIPGKAGTVIRTPYRVLAAEDVMFKEMAKQAHLNSLITREAINTTKNSKDFKSVYESLKENPTPEMLKKADDMALYMTFNKDLGKVGQSIQGLISSHPAFGVIVPFVRTPTNVVKFALERTPLAVFSKNVQAEIKKGGSARDLAVSKMIVGSAWAYAGYQLAESGSITGGGPVEPDERSTWLQTHKPYSFRFNGNDYAYNRFEPVGTFFGAAADVSAVWKAAGTEDKDKLAALLSAAVTKNIGNKTMVAGMSSAILAYTDANRYGERFINQLAGSVVPTISAEIAQARDPIYRQIDSVVDAIKARTPGLSKDLYPKRDLYGQPIKRHEGGAQAFMVSPGHEVQTDLAYTELGRLGISVGPPERKVMGKELDISVYDRYQRDAGELAFKMNSKIVNHPSYLAAPEFLQKELLESSFREARKIARIINGIDKERVNMTVEELRKEVGK